MIELFIVAAIAIAATGSAAYTFYQLNTLKAEKQLQEEKRDRINALIEVAQKLEKFGETMLNAVPVEDLDGTLSMAFVSELATIQSAIANYKVIGDRLEKRYTGALNTAYAKIGFPVAVNQNNSQQKNNQNQGQQAQQK